MSIRPKILRAYIFLTLATSVALLAPDLWLIFSMLLFMLPLFVPTVWIYATLLLPVLLLQANKGLPLLSKAVSVGFTAAFAFGVPMSINAAADRKLLELTADDFSKPTANQIRHVAIVKNGYVGDARKNPLASSECDSLCQRLLLGGTIESVTVVARDGKEEISTVQFRIEKRRRCPEAFESFGRAIQATVLNAVNGTCMVPVVGKQMTDGLVIQQSRSYLDDTLLDLGGMSVISSRLMISERSSESMIPIAQSTTIEYTKPYVLLALHIHGFFGPVRWAIVGHPVTKNDVTSAEFLQRHYGFPSLPAVTGIGRSSALAREGKRAVLDVGIIAGLLADANPVPYDRVVSGAITHWVAQFAEWNAKPPLPSETDLIGKMVADRRIAGLYFIYRTLERNAQLTKDIAPRIVSRICAPDNRLDKYDYDYLINPLRYHRALANIERIEWGPTGVEQFKRTYCPPGEQPHRGHNPINFLNSRD